MSLMYRIIRWSIANRLFVVIAALAITAYGAVTALRMPVDVFPDLTAPTVPVVTAAPALAPSKPLEFVPQRIVYDDLQGIVYQRYGATEPTLADFENGSGQHVGTVFEIASRLQGALYFIGSRWKDPTLREYVEDSNADPDPISKSDSDESLAREVMPLVALARRGDRGSWSTLYDIYAPVVHAGLLLRVAHPPATGHRRALAALARRARALTGVTAALHPSSGADLDLARVRQPAAAVPSAMSASSTSGRPL